MDRDETRVLSSSWCCDMLHGVTWRCVASLCLIIVLSVAVFEAESIVMSSPKYNSTCSATDNRTCRKGL